jgi:hypothetical protein
MAKKRKVNKTQAVRDYLKNHPTATSGEISAALNKIGVKVTPNYAANIKTNEKRGSASKKPVKRAAVVEATAPVAVEKPAKTADTVTLDQVKKVVQLTKTLGGYQRVNDLLDTIRELGGVKKFKELAAAIADTEADAIPF